MAQKSVSSSPEFDYVLSFDAPSVADSTSLDHLPVVTSNHKDMISVSSFDQGDDHKEQSAAVIPPEQSTAQQNGKAPESPPSPVIKQSSTDQAEWNENSLGDIDDFLVGPKAKDSKIKSKDLNHSQSAKSGKTKSPKEAVKESKNTQSANNSSAESQESKSTLSGITGGLLGGFGWKK